MRPAGRIEPENSSWNHARGKRTIYNAMSVHPAGERPSVVISLSFRVFLYSVVSTAAFRVNAKMPRSKDARNRERAMETQV